MMTKLKSPLTAFAAIVTTTSAGAQSIDQQETAQEARIQDGEASGKLSHAEALQLSALETHLLRTEARMRWQYGGHLSQLQRRTLQRLADQDSATINQMVNSTIRSHAPLSMKPRDKED